MLVYLSDAVFATCPVFAPARPLRHLMQMTEQLNSRCVTLGWCKTQSGWHLSAETSKFYTAYLALLEVASCQLCLSGCLGGVLAYGVQRLPRLNLGAVGSMICFRLPAEPDRMYYRSIMDTKEIWTPRVLEMGNQWPQYCIIQFHVYPDSVLQEAQDEDRRVPEASGIHLPEEDPSIRSPISFRSATSSAQSPSHVSSASAAASRDDQAAVADDGFWEEWDQEIADDCLAASDVSPCVEDWEQVFAYGRPPDPCYDFGEEEPTFGCEYWDARLRSIPHPEAFDFLSGKAYRELVERAMSESTSWQDEPAELVMPCGLAYLSGLLDEGAAWEIGDRAVFAVDKHGARSCVIERSAAQSNQDVTAEEIRKNPELVKSAVLAELKRWVDNVSFRRQKRTEAHNTLDARYVLAWKR